MPKHYSHPWCTNIPFTKDVQVKPELLTVQNTVMRVKNALYFSI